MSNVGKVSFSFSKITKKPSLQVQPKETVKKVDKIEYIDSIENNSVQLINGEETDVKKPLVIPLQHPNLLLQSVIDAVKSRKESSPGKPEEPNDDNVNTNESSENLPENTESQPPKNETLEEMAARELIEEATNQTKEPEPSNLTVPLANENYNKEESSLDDYESIPINDFGLAMLRGMGWDPKKGIGKNGQVIKVAGPTLRPKGLGLGADKSLAAQKPVGKNVSEKEVLGKGSKIRVTVGPLKNLYGTVEGFDDDAGRINLLMAISNERVSINECFVQLVTPDEFSKYSKVLNINAYNNYKEKESNRTDTNEECGKEEKKNVYSNNGRSESSIPKDDRHASSSHSKPDKPKKHEYEDKYSKDSKKSSSHRDKSYRKKYDSSSDSDSHKHKMTATTSSKSRHYSKHHDSDDERKKKSKHSSKSKHSKKHSSDSESSSDERHKRKNRSKDSRKDRERRRSPSSDSDYDRKHKHKKSKKKKNRSRSRSRR